MRLILFTISLLWTLLSFSQERVDGKIIQTKDTTSTTKKGSTNDFINIYQKYLSGLKSSTCPMYPSCSNYGLSVYDERPFFEATTLLADRLIRCSHDRKFYKTTHAYGYYSLLDLPYYEKCPKSLIDNNNPNPRADEFKADTKRDSINLFINHLINKNLYQEALLELNRIEFFKKTLTPDQYISKLICYQGLKKEEQGVFEYETSFPRNIRNNPKVALKASKIYFDLDNYKNSEETLNHIFINSKDSNIIYKAYILDALISVKQHQYAKTKHLFDVSNRYENDSITYKQNLSILNQLKGAKKKNPTLAQLLSIIPGGGYLYAGHLGSALTSFAVNLLLGYATYTSIKSNNYGVAALTGFMSVSFYFGNIKGAGRSAKRYNTYINDRYFNKLSRLNKLIIY
ncbi:MAG: membrane protein insertion efficiency factor YidD [Bacteroidaceae bacterium]